MQANLRALIDSWRVANEAQGGRVAGNYYKKVALAVVRLVANRILNDKLAMLLPLLLPLLLLLLLIVVLATASCVVWHSSHWWRRGVAGPCGRPLLGNMLQFALGLRSYGDIYAELYK